MSQTMGRPADVGAAFPALDRVVPAGIGRRVLARAADVVLGLGAAGVLTVIALLGPDPSDPRAVAAYALAVQVCSVALVLGVLSVFAVTGMLPGDAVLGLRQVRVSSGGPPGPAGVVKYLVLTVLTLVTLGLGYLVTLLTVRRDRWCRSWMDRRLGLMVIDIRQGRDPRHERAGAPPAGEVVSVDEVAGRAAAEPPPPPGPRPVEEAATRVNPRVGTDVRPVRVRLPGGHLVVIDGPTAFGRNPAEPPGHPGARLMPVHDPGRSVSKTHAVLSPQPGGVLVEDLQSTNGTSILTDRGSVPVPPGVRLAARVGWQVALADFVLVVEDA